MNPLIIEKGEFTPFVKLDPENHSILIQGVSRPENAKNFYAPIIDWVVSLEGELYQKKKDSDKIIPLHVTFKFMYFNSASAKMVFMMLECLNRLKKQGFEVVIDWFYEDGDDQMLDDGQELSEALQLGFNCQVIK